MRDETDNEPRAWNDNHPWTECRCASAAADGDLLLRGQKIEIRWVFQFESFKSAEDSDTAYFRGLAYDRQGRFYAITESVCDRPLNEPRTLIRKLTGKAALTWFAKNAAWDEPFARELCRAIDNPAFEFMPLVSTRAVVKPRRKRKAKGAEVFYEQLQLATALVECVRKLEAEPTTANLADACRSVSTLHQAIHKPENFKLAAHG